MIGRGKRCVHQTGTPLCLQKSLSNGTIKAFRIFPHGFLRVERPRKRCRILGLETINGPIAFLNGRLPLTGEVVEVGGKARDSRWTRQTRWTRWTRGARDGWAVSAPLMLRFDSGTDLLSTIGCRQEIASLGLSMRGRNGNVVAIPSDTRLITTTLQVELIG